jgi:NADH:ubiquinone reductase (H+-translocating)
LQSVSGRAPVVIVGGGFAGLECARKLGQRGVPTVLIDRRNHNLFQPLLYQVATAALSPADIAEPIRKSLGRYKSISIVLGEVIRVDPLNRTVATDTGLSFEFGSLVLATGSTYNYFDHPDWALAAPGLKTLPHAQDIRQRLLMALEQAEYSADPVARRALLTSVIVGGGPTGVEMAGAIAELAHSAVREYRTIRADDFRILLVEAGPRLLGTFPEKLSIYAESELRGLGVEVRTGTKVL